MTDRPPEHQSPVQPMLNPLSLSAVVAPLGFGVAASVTTLLGGALGLRFSDRIGLILGLTAGVVIGVALFDLLPEAASAADNGLGGRAVPLWLGMGFMLYMLVRRGGAAFGTTTLDRHLAPALLSLHSLMDGIGIGLGFQVSPAIGGLVAAAVLTHDLADGVNTVSLCLATGEQRLAKAWLIVNGAAPLIGVIVGLTIHLSEAMLAPLMAMFAGAFLFIGACELLPRSLAIDPRLRTTAASVTGLILMVGVTTLAG